MKNQQNETEITKCILQYLQYRKIFCYKNRNTGLFRQGRWTPAIQKGVPDIVGVLGGNMRGRALYIEVKAKDNKPSKEQEEFIRNAQDRGAICGVVWCIEDTTKLLANAGYDEHIS